MLIEILVFLLTTLFFYAIYYHKKLHKFFDGKGVKYLPGVPLLGNNYKGFLQKHNMIDDIDVVYKAFPNEKYVGYIEGMTPIVLIKDPDLIKMITVKDFDHFTDHRQFFSDPLFNESLFMMKGDRWRDMRTTLSPAFTGSKMRQMVPFMTETSENIVEYLKDIEGQEINVDNLVRRYTNDIIASTAFGLRVNSLKEPDNEFYRTGQKLVNFTFWQKMVMALFTMMPSLAQLVPIFPKETTNFFRDMVRRTMKYREKNNIERPDMIQLLMEAYKGTLKSNTTENDSIGFATTEDIEMKPENEVRRWTQDEIAAQAFIFFFAGYESSASAVVMCLHELVLNPEVQETLYEELKNYNKSRDNLTYEGLQELKYLDCVINETLRKWSAALILDRLCLKPYTLPPPREGGLPYSLKPGDILYHCVNSQQMDEKYYPNPHKFDPTRFSDENKHKIQPFTFMPFGVGPRNCIGSRFALLELKVLLYYIITNFEVVKCSKTLDPIRLEKSSFNIRAEGGTYVKVVSRIQA